jgi:hypothetical protein
MGSSGKTVHGGDPSSPSATLLTGRAGVSTSAGSWRLKREIARHRSVWNGPQNIDLIFLAEPGQSLQVRSLWRWKNSLPRRLGHLFHHPDESAAGHCENQHFCRSGASDLDTMRNSSWQEKVGSGTRDRLFTIAGKSRFPVQNIKSFILNVVKMIRRRGTWRRQLMTQRESSASRLCRGLHGNQVVQKPIGWAFFPGKYLWQKFWQHAFPSLMPAIVSSWTA